MKHALWLALSLPLIGCSDPSFDEEENLRRTQSQLVARVNVAPSHAVEFYELRPGVVAIYEHGSIDNGDKPLDTGSLENKSLAELHALLAPGTPVPEKLLQLEQRQQAFRESQAAPPAEAMVQAALPVGAVKPPLRPPPQTFLRP